MKIIILAIVLILTGCNSYYTFEPSYQMFVWYDDDTSMLGNYDNLADCQDAVKYIVGSNAPKIPNTAYCQSTLSKWDFLARGK
jgi:hypothetical protein